MARFYSQKKKQFELKFNNVKTGTTKKINLEKKKHL